VKVSLDPSISWPLLYRSISCRFKVPTPVVYTLEILTYTWVEFTHSLHKISLDGAGVGGIVGEESSVDIPATLRMRWFKVSAMYKFPGERNTYQT